jgi:hypothetical protein
MRIRRGLRTFLVTACVVPAIWIDAGPASAGGDPGVAAGSQTTTYNGTAANGTTDTCKFRRWTQYTFTFSGGPYAGPRASINCEKNENLDIKVLYFQIWTQNNGWGTISTYPGGHCNVCSFVNGSKQFEGINSSDHNYRSGAKIQIEFRGENGPRATVTKYSAPLFCDMPPNASC